MWLALSLAVSLSPPIILFFKLSDPREVINGSSYSFASLPNYGKAKITESQTWPGTGRGHHLPQAPASRQGVRDDSARAREAMKADRLISSRLVPAAPFPCQQQMTKPT